MPATYESVGKSCSLTLIAPFISIKLNIVGVEKVLCASAFEPLVHRAFDEIVQLIQFQREITDANISRLMPRAAIDRYLEFEQLEISTAGFVEPKARVSQTPELSPLNAHERIQHHDSVCSDKAKKLVYLHRGVIADENAVHGCPSVAVEKDLKLTQRPSICHSRDAWAQGLPGVADSLAVIWVVYDSTPLAGLSTLRGKPGLASGAYNLANLRKPGLLFQRTYARCLQRWTSIRIPPPISYRK